MRLEAFSLGKKFGHPEANEDSFVAIPGAGYAVIDGVTDRNGTRYDGMLSGQFASRTVKRAIERMLVDAKRPAYEGPERFIEYLTATLREGYVVEGALSAVEADWKIRVSCTVVAAIHVDDRIEIVALGDSGIRINGSDVLQVLKPLDDVTALLRRETWRYFATRGRAIEDCDRLAASTTWLGTRHQPTGIETSDPAVVREIEAKALAACHERLGDLPDAELLHLIQHGIAHGQGDYQNATGKVLGYGGLDGFPVPRQYIEHRTYARADVDTLELFSDGYFEPGSGFGIDMWEASFRDVEAADPHKIDRYISTKGTTAAQFTDDRTYLGVRLR